MTASKSTKFAVVVDDDSEDLCFASCETLPEAKGIGYGLFCMAENDVRVIIYSVDENNRKKRVFTFGGQNVTQDEQMYANMHYPSKELLDLFAVQ